MRGTIVTAALAVLLLPALAGAQTPVRSFDQLDTRLKVGDKVSVTDTQGREVKGKVLAFDAVSITLDKPGATLPADRVSVIQERKGSKLLGMLVGLGAGVAVASLQRQSAETYEGQETIVPFCIGVGAGVGALVGAFVPRFSDIYQAPDGRPGARVRLAPVVAPRTKGVALSFSF